MYITKKFMERLSGLNDLDLPQKFDSKLGQFMAGKHKDQFCMISSDKLLVQNEPLQLYDVKMVRWFCQMLGLLSCNTSQINKAHFMRSGKS